jgi:hypothetical protein
MPYMHKLQEKAIPLGGYENLPAPHSWLRGAEVYSPDGGMGWLGFHRENERISFWHVLKDFSCKPLDFSEIHVLVDSKTGNVWMLFSGGSQSHPFLLFPDEAVGLSYTPQYVQQLLSERKTCA